MKTNRLLKVLNREPVDCTPIWIMRQAGRYLPEYQATRKKAGDFLSLCKNPELACEVTLQPIRRFSLDGAIIFSDILTIPDAMGLGLYFSEQKGPEFLRPIRTAKQILSLPIPDPESELRYVSDAIRLVRKELNGIPLIGFAGSPWTLATYMLEGKASKDFLHTRKFLYQEPELLHQLLKTLTAATILYLNAQIAAGAQILMLFDTWGGMLTPENYQKFSLQYMKEIIVNIKKTPTQKIPIILFTKGGGQWLELIAEAGTDAIGLDWTVDIAEARKRVSNNVLQGNLDPAVLLSSPAVIREEVASVLQKFGKGSGHIFNLGHGIIKEVPPEHVAVLVDAVHELSIPFHVQ